MHEYERTLEKTLKKEITKKSLFLFGPRQTGKTHLLKKIFPHSPFYNILLADVFLKVSQRPQLIREEVLMRERKSCPIIIDEIQKLPIVLDEVQNLIEEHGLHFILTGSSARKLKRGAANLLGGRAWTRHIFPLTTKEIGRWNLLRILNFGSLPFIYDSETAERDLAAYVGTYLQEEIQAEGISRKIENFSRFLQTASFTCTELLNFANVAQDAQVSPRTVSEYYTVLQDTLIGQLLPPFTKTKKRKAFSTAKFYFFDIGVCNYLAGRKNIRPRTELFGKVFEHFIFTELRAWQSYTGRDQPLTYWRSHSGYEVDFLIGDEIAIEAKGTELATGKHVTGLKALGEEIKLKKKILISMDKAPRKIGDIEVLPIPHFLDLLWGNGL